MPDLDNQDVPPDASTHLGPHGAPCDRCASPLAGDQRYCLQCGHRRGPARLEVLAAARGTSGRRPVIPADQRPNRPPAGTRAVPRLPGPRVSALLTAAMLVTGVALGTAAGPRASSSFAAGARKVIAIVRAPAPAPVVAAAPAKPPAPVTPAPPVNAGTPGPVLEPSPVLPTASATPVPITPTGGPQVTPTPTGTGNDTPETGVVSKLPPVKHVWLISLTGQRYEETWGPQAAEPNFTALRAQGALLPRSFAVAHGSVPGAVALLSGQGPNPATQGDCPIAAPLTPGTIDEHDKLTQAKGIGCLYPAAVSTLPDQLSDGGLTWKAYAESIASPDPQAEQTCRHAVAGQGDPFAAPRPGDPYLSTRNPFLFFAKIVGDATACAAGVVGLDALAPDLATPDNTPTFSYIIPNTCHDGRDVPCADGAPAGLAAAGPWLVGVVDQIRATAAYKAGGLIIITGDQAPGDGPHADSRSCRCAPDLWPNTPNVGTSAAPGKGGGRVGTLLLSRFVTPGATIPQSYDQVSILKSVEDLFGLDHLGAAADKAHKPWGPQVYARYTPPAP